MAVVTAPYRYGDPARVPERPVAIVFGAGVVNGALTPALADRVRGAVALYQRGRVSKILMTGDNSRQDYDEATAMGRYAVTLGVPQQDITLDYAGFSTYESAYRARDIFGVRQATLVTQGYHLPRAVYTCRQLGIDAVGLWQPDWLYEPARMAVHYSLGQKIFYTGRELLAAWKALWQIHVTHPTPTFLGPYEGIK